MYDITNEKTFHNIKYWIAQIEEHAFQAGMTTSEQSLPGMIIKNCFTVANCQKACLHCIVIAAYCSINEDGGGAL